MEDKLIKILSNVEKLYFLTLDEQNNQDFLIFLTEIQKKYQDNVKIQEYIKNRIKEKEKIIIKIKKLKEIIKQEIRQLSPNTNILTFFLQSNLNKIFNIGNINN